MVTSRSADECVVALMDQWYLNYGEPEWKKQTEGLLANMNTYTLETRHAFQKTLDWLNHDSTVYMSYYTVAQLLHASTATNPAPRHHPEQMTDEIWEYVFCNGPFPSPSPLPKEKADALKHEYSYFYPFDIRSSAKDLVPNHLTFALYNHVALFPEDKWPLSMRTNGHLMLNGKKMSKSTGNSLTLRESIEKFGADATRLSLADAGDGLEDANFEEKTANANILRLHTLLDWCKEQVTDQAKLRTGPRTFHDDVFENEVNDLINFTQSHYDATNYKDALKYGFYELQSARDWYREVTAESGMHKDLEPKSIQCARWPTPEKPVDQTIIEAGQYMRGTVKTIRDAETTLLKMMQKAAKGKKVLQENAFDPKKPKSVRVYVAKEFPEWQNRVMPFIQAFKKRMAQYGAQTAFRRTLPFSEIHVLNELSTYLKKSLNLVDAEVMSVDEAHAHEGEAGYTKSIIDTSEPGAPAFEYRNV
ncbi:Nucleotidylyl transferase [Coprinellus micaceus]|uniref:Nucleotidylyl transferase n=1 Tax=Coprinellus micaceus TaxID=71717 RepID=A0A4Y7SA64_COPMI|nr:Nucleotidylyl transferase [Coprinellus micaceus]